MSTTVEAAHSAQAKDEFFAASMYMFHVTGFPQQSGVLTHPAAAPPGARLDVWRTDPADGQHIPRPGAEGIMLSTQGFSLANSGNRTLHAPKRSWKVELEGAAHGGAHLARQSQIHVQRPLADAGGAGLAPTAQRGHTGGAAHLRQARVRRYLLRPVLAH
jgi:hypothetical protein